MADSRRIPGSLPLASALVLGLIGELPARGLLERSVRTGKALAHPHTRWAGAFYVPTIEIDQARFLRRA